MITVGDLVWSNKTGECLGVVTEILFDQFAVMVRGVGKVNANHITVPHEDLSTKFQDIKPGIVIPYDDDEEPYLEMYKITK